MGPLLIRQEHCKALPCISLDLGILRCNQVINKQSVRERVARRGMLESAEKTSYTHLMEYHNYLAVLNLPLKHLVLVPGLPTSADVN